MDRVHDVFGSLLAALWLEPGGAVRERLRERGLGFVLERPCLFPAPAEQRAELRVEILGPLRVWRGSEEIPARAFKRRKARELLAMLALARGRPVGKETLMDQLFPDSSPDAAERDFRVVLHHLTQVLEPERPKGAPARSVTRREESYQLELEAVALDLAEFEQRAPRAAAELVRGELLADYPYAEWLTAEREAVRVRSLRVLMVAAEGALAAGQPAAAEEAARRALELDSCLEEAYRVLMRVQLDSGHEYLARRIFDQCRQRLAEELGVEPQPATAALLREKSRIPT
jgi:DNA-binding SARP family transcriptional activator